MVSSSYEIADHINTDGSKTWWKFTYNRFPFFPFPFFLPPFLLFSFLSSLYSISLLHHSLISLSSLSSLSHHSLISISSVSHHPLLPSLQYPLSCPTYHNFSFYSLTLLKSFHLSFIIFFWAIFLTAGS